MFRSVAVNNGERISVKDNWLIVNSVNGESRIPVEDLYAVVIDNQQAVVTVPALWKLTSVGAHILICDDKHRPVSVVLPQNTHFHPLTVIRKQIALTDAFKDELWDRIAAQKIKNQAEVLRLCGGEREKVERLKELSQEVKNGDVGNREGIAAKMFFREMYGSAFVRMNDDAINAALNYGYAIIRSAFCKTLTGYGFNCVLGIHHISESNPFNLADDLMEPLRPFVDMWVDDNIESLVSELTKEHRNKLISLVNDVAVIDGKRMRIRNAIDRYVRSFSTAVDRQDAGALLIPEVVRTTEKLLEKIQDDQP